MQSDEIFGVVKNVIKNYKIEKVFSGTVKNKKDVISLYKYIQENDVSEINFS